MIITATNKIPGRVDLSALQRFHEDNPIEREPFRSSIGPGEQVEVDDKYYTLVNIQNSLVRKWITISDYNQQDGILVPESLTANYDLTKVRILNRADYPQDEFSKFNANMDSIDTLLSSGTVGATWGNILGSIGNQSDLFNNFLTISNASSTYETISNVFNHTSNSSIHYLTTEIDHTDLQNVGNNTHSQIDTDLIRLANTSGANTGDQDLSGYLPYTGADQDVDLGANDFTTDGTINTNGLIVNTTIVYAKYVDGTSNEIQTAVDSISDNSETNRYVVIVPPGDYYEQVTLKTGVSLKAEALRTVKLKRPQSTFSGIIINGGYLSIENIEVDNRVTETISILDNVVNVTIKNCIIHISDYDGILFEDSGISNVQILNNLFVQSEATGTKSWDAINVRNQANVTIKGNVIDYTPNVGEGRSCHGIMNANATTIIEDNFVRLVSSTNECNGITPNMNSSTPIRTKNNRIIVTTSGGFVGYGIKTLSNNAAVSVMDDISATTYDLYAYNGAITTYLTNYDTTKTSGNVIDSFIFKDNVTANSFITDGGTSSDFVKGDGSLDSSTYLTGITSESIGDLSDVTLTASKTLTITDSTSLGGGTHSGTNTGDQTSIVGITGTKSQFNTALTDGSFAFSGGAFHDGFSDFVANEHIDWTAASAGTIHSSNYTNTTYTAGDGLTLVGTEFQNTDKGSDVDLSPYWKSDGTSTATGDWDLGAHNLTVDTNTLFVDSINHRVGIGTISPEHLFHAYSPSSAVFEIESGGTTGVGARYKNTEGEFGIITDNGELKFYDYTDARFGLIIDTNGNIKLPNDNAKLYQGAGDDYSQYFDGTNQNFELTSGKFNFNADVDLGANDLKTTGNISGDMYFDYIIAADGSGDYTDIRTALLANPAYTTFFIKDGTYVLTEDVYFKSGQVLVGESKKGVIIDQNETGYNIQGAIYSVMKSFSLINGRNTLGQIVLNGDYSSIVENVFIDSVAGYTAVPNYGAGLKLQSNSYDCYINNVEVNGFIYNFAIEYSDRTRLSNLLSRNGNYGIRFRQANYSVLSNSISNTDNNPIYMRDSSNGLISNIVVNNAGTATIYFYNTGESNNNIFTNVNSDAPNTVLIRAASGNIFNSVKFSSIALYGSSNKFIGSKMDNVQIYSGANDNEFIGNTFLSLSDSGTGTVVSGNSYTNPQNIINQIGDIKILADNAKLYFGAGDDYSQYFDGTNQNFELTSGDFVFSGGDVKIGADNQKLYFGTDNDASIYYDGTDLIIDPKEVGTGSVVVDGTLEATKVDITASTSDNTDYALIIKDSSSDEKAKFRNDGLVQFFANNNNGTTSNYSMLWDPTGFGNAGSLNLIYSHITLWGASKIWSINQDIKLDGAHASGKGMRVWGSSTTNPDIRLYDGKTIFGAGVTTLATETVEVEGNLFLNGDNDKILLGTGKDASIYYDGTNLYIKTDEVVASDLHITCGTDKTLVLDETVYADIDFPIIIRTTGVGQPALTPFNGNLLMPEWEVDDFNMCESQELIHEWKEGSQINWHLHLTTNGTDIDNRYVKFELEYAYTVDGVWTFPAVFTSDDILIPANTPDKKQHIISITDFTPTGSKIGDHVLARLKRVAATGTAPTGDPWIPMLQMHILKDTLGSRQIDTK